MEQIQEILQKTESILGSYPDIRIAYIFGSAVKNRLRENSDLDIAISVGRPLDYHQSIAIASQLSMELKREIDLIDLSTTHGILLNEIMIKGKLVLCRDNQLKAELYKEVVYFSEDLLPQIRQLLDTRVRRFAFG